MGEDQMIIGHSVFEVGGVKCPLGVLFSRGWSQITIKYFVFELKSNAYTTWVSYYLISTLGTLPEVFWWVESNDH